MADFLTALSYTLGNEGGYSDNPNDAGGPTNYGITQATAEAYGYTGDMADLDLGTAQAIYQSEYWDTWSLGSIPAQGPATAIFDLHVNMGGGAAKVVQAALAATGWTGTQDGAWGPQTLAGVIAAPPAALLVALSAAAANRYQSIAASNPADQTFLSGWLNRAAALGQLAVGSPLTSSAVLLLAAGAGYLLLNRRHG